MRPFPRWGTVGPHRHPPGCSQHQGTYLTTLVPKAHFTGTEISLGPLPRGRGGGRGGVSLLPPSPPLPGSWFPEVKMVGSQPGRHLLHPSGLSFLTCTLDTGEGLGAAHGECSARVSHVPLLGVRAAGARGNHRQTFLRDHVGSSWSVRELPLSFSALFCTWGT